MESLRGNAARLSFATTAIVIFLVVGVAGGRLSELSGARSRRMLAADGSAASVNAEIISSLNTTNVRTYYISIDEVAWDYAPGDGDLCFNRPYTDMELPYARPTNTSIGSKYMKAQFR